MIVYNLSRIVAANSLQRKNIYSAEIAIWVMEPTGKPPSAVYITYDKNQTYRLLSHIPSNCSASEILDPSSGLLYQLGKTGKKMKHNDLNVQKGALIPIAKRLNDLIKFPIALTNKHLFSGVIDNVPERFTASLWVQNGKGENQKIYDLNLKAKQHTSKYFTFLFFKKRFRKIHALVYKASHYIAMKIAAKYFKKPTKYFCIPNPERLGHLIGNTDVFLSELNSGFYPDVRKLELYYRLNQIVQDVGILSIKERISNRAFCQLLSKKYKMWPLNTFKASVFESVWHKKNSIIQSRPHGHRDIHNVLEASAPIIDIPENYIKQGKALLKKAGIINFAKIALVHMRSEHYTQRQYKEFSSLESARYGYRNVEGASYVKTINYLSSIGYSIFVMGVESKKLIKANNPVFYARQLCKEDWFDLYLASICKFFLGDTSGAYTLADLFRKPIIFTNFAPIGHVYSWSKRHITIFKKLIHKHDHQAIPVSQLLNTTLGYTIHMDKINSDHYAYIDNTADEILSVTREMIARLQGSWTETQKDLVRQKKFWSRLPLGYLHLKINSRVGTDYLRENAWLNM